MQIVVGICLFISFVNFTRWKRKESKPSNKLVSKRKLHPKINIIIGIFLVCLTIFTRLYKIEELLNGLHVDEVGMGYDAFCIANYGVDRYLHHFPVYMINFGGGQSALYTYLAAIIVKILGLNTLAIRLPGVILSFISILSNNGLPIWKVGLSQAPPCTSNSPIDANTYQAPSCPWSSSCP